MNEFKKRRGRPPGAKTKTPTPAMKIAAEYVDLLGEGMRPTQAMRKVAGNWQVQEETVRKYKDRHISRVLEVFEHEFAKRSAQFVDTDKVNAAMREVRYWVDEVLNGWLATWPAELAALESQEAIHAWLTEAMRNGLLELSQQALSRAKELANEPGSAIDPAIPHGGVMYLEAFAQAVKPPARFKETLKKSPLR